MADNANKKKPINHSSKPVSKSAKLSGANGGKSHARSTTKKPSQKTTTGKPRKKTAKSGSSRKKTGSGNVFRGWILAIFALIIITGGTIIILDQKAVKQGQPGLVEIVTKQPVARAIPDLETRLQDVLKLFGISRDQLIRKGKVTGRATEKLFQLVYKIPSKTDWLDLVSNFEGKCDDAGIKVHNRIISKSRDKWQYRVFLGTPGKRTHRIEFHFFPQENAIQQPSEPVSTVRPAEPDAPRIGLVFDDFGSDILIARKFLSALNIPITIAVIPNLKYSTQTIREVKTKGQTAFLHLPMEPISQKEMGGQTDEFLTTEMSDEALLGKLRQIVRSLPEVDGVNNHMGSRLTCDRHRMTIILKELQQMGLPFLDSRTTADSIAADVARSLKIPHGQRAVFLDQGYKGGDVAANFRKLAEIAKEKGSAIGIGHAQPETLKIIQEMFPEIQTMGVRIVPVPQLLTVES